MRKMGKCHKCGRIFKVGDECLLGDYGWVCYTCQFNMTEKGTWKAFVEEMLKLHSGSGQCKHGHG